MIGLILSMLAAQTPSTVTLEPATPGSMVTVAEWVVEVSLDVTSEGRVTGCQVRPSNAPAELQAKTCPFVQENVKLTPKRDAKGRAIASVFTTRVRYRVTDKASADGIVAEPVLPAASISPTDPLETPLAVSDWSGACRKSRLSDKRFSECTLRYVQPDMAATIRRTVAGMNISVTAPSCGTDVAAGRAFVRKDLLTPSFGKAAVGSALAAAIFFARRNCPAMPTHLNTQIDFADLIAATGPLQKAR